MTKVIVAIIVLGLVITGLIAAGNAGWGPIVINKEGQQQLILSLGPPRAVIEPGWSLRFPFIETAVAFDRRLLYLNTKSDVVQTIDQERIVVDNYVMWRIADPIAFQSSFPRGRGQAEKQIDRVVRAQVREVIGTKTLTHVLTDQRIEIMKTVSKDSAASLAGSGLAIDDVRINRTELPPGIEKNVYARMETDRERLARKHRAEGEEQARLIRAQADRAALVIVAQARGKAEISRGEGDAEAARIYAKSFNIDPDFYAFVRSLEAYRKTIGVGTTVVLSPNSEFFQYLGGWQGASGDTPKPPASASGSGSDAGRNSR
ncbi:MAG: protease modulator HflC [Myxococcota bacterium]